MQVNCNNKERNAHIAYVIESSVYSYAGYFSVVVIDGKGKPNSSTQKRISETDPITENNVC